jgi:hypothetical protein
MLFVEISAALAGPKPGLLLLGLAFAQYPGRNNLSRPLPCVILAKGLISQLVQCIFIS